MPISKAARLIGVHVNSVRRWVLTGKVLAWQRSGRYFVSRQDMLDMTKPVLHRPNGDECKKHKPGPKPKIPKWVRDELRDAGIEM